MHKHTSTHTHTHYTHTHIRQDMHAREPSSIHIHTCIHATSIHPSFQPSVHACMHASFTPSTSHFIRTHANWRQRYTWTEWCFFIHLAPARKMLGSPTGYVILLILPLCCIPVTPYHTVLQQQVAIHHRQFCCITWHRDAMYVQDAPSRGTIRQPSQSYKADARSMQARTLCLIRPNLVEMTTEIRSCNDKWYIYIYNVTPPPPNHRLVLYRNYRAKKKKSFSGRSGFRVSQWLPKPNSHFKKSAR